MFRRRSPSPPPPPPPAVADTTGRPQTPDLLGELSDAGWVLPRLAGADAAPHWSLVGTVSSPTATPVDPAGLVVGEGWSLDWWIGADDRWHVPAREAAVRQQLEGEAPVVETLVRIPGGDAVARAYGIRSPRPVGDEWVVAEITNATPVPLALALVVRPFTADAVGEVSTITIEPTNGGQGREVAHLVRIDGRPAMVLPRRPARLAAGGRASGDVAEPVTNGEAGVELVAADCPDGLATLAMVFPLTHTATLRVLIPVGEVGEEGGSLDYPAVVPDAATVASGWDVHRRSPRFEIPEARLATAVARAQAQVHLAHDGVVVRRDGHRSPDLDPGATEVILGALDLLDRSDDVAAVLARWPEHLADPSVDVDAMFLVAVSRHWMLHRADPLLDALLPEVAAAVERIGRADRKGRLTSPAGRRRAHQGLQDAATMLGLAGQAEAAARVRSLADRVGTDLAEREPVAALDHLEAAAAELAAGDVDGLRSLDVALGEASPTGAWPGPGPDGRPVGTDLAAAAALVTATRHLLVSERDDGLALLPVHPERWYGGGIELHDAPTAFGHLSYAVRWHGKRPALLWELTAHPGAAPVRLCVPGLDPAWSTTEARGDALLAEVSPPEGLDPVREVAEHPDIDPDMRRPGSAPDEAPNPLPDGGSFS